MGVIALAPEGSKSRANQLKNLRIGNPSQYGGQRRLQPHFDRHLKELRADFSTDELSDRRLRLLAGLLARVDSAEAFLGKRAAIVNANGEALPVCGEIERWSARADAILAELEQARRDQPPEPATMKTALAWLREQDV